MTKQKFNLYSLEAVELLCNVVAACGQLRIFKTDLSNITKL